MAAVADLGMFDLVEHMVTQHAQTLDDWEFFEGDLEVVPVVVVVAFVVHTHLVVWERDSQLSMHGYRTADRAVGLAEHVSRSIEVFHKLLVVGHCRCRNFLRRRGWRFELTTDT